MRSRREAGRFMVAEARYHAYVLRCWRERAGGRDDPEGWRFSLEDPRTGERRGFASLALLVSALQAELAGAGEVPPGAGTARHDERGAGRAESG